MISNLENAANDITRFTFYKESSGTWYLDLPDYPGPKCDLAMVAGADDMLDYLAKGKKHVIVDMCELPMEGALKMEMFRMGEPGGGAYYKPVDHAIQSVWLCDVTLYALGKFPDTIYFKAVS